MASPPVEGNPVGTVVEWSKEAFMLSFQTEPIPCNKVNLHGGA